MEAENYFETQINGLGLEIRLVGQTLKVKMKSRESGKRYVGDLTHQAQSEIFKFNFGDMEQAFLHMKKAFTTQNGMLRVSPQGKLQIGVKSNQRVRYLPLEIQQVELQITERLIQVVSFVKKDMDVLKVSIEKVNINLDEQQANMLKIKQQLTQQIAHLKQQFLETINLKSDAQVTDRKVVSLKQQIIQKLTEDKSQYEQLIANLKTQMDSLLLRQSKNNEEKLNEANARIQELKRQTRQLGKNSELQLARHTELERQVGQLGRNTEVQLARYTQMKDVHTVLQSRLQEEAKKFKLTEALLNQKFPKMLGSRFIQLTVDPNFGQFQAGYYKMRTNSDRIFQKVTDHEKRQVVSKEQLPRKGKYYFQLIIHYSATDATGQNYPYVMVGVITQSLRQNQTSNSNQQSITYFTANGSVYENGSNRTVGTTMWSQKGLVTVVIDADQRKISWYYDHQLQYSTVISQTIMDKKIYACVQVTYAGTILQFKS